jgi:hypothetical protein
MTGRDQFLRDQDKLRRKAQRDHARNVDANARDRQESYFQHAGERDKRIREDMNQREQARRNDEYKKSVFFAEIQQAKVENRAPIYRSYLDVPDMVPPRQAANVETPWGTLLLIIGFVILLVGAAIVTFFRMFGGVILGLLITAGVAYLAITAVWLYLLHVKKPTTPDDIARAAAWNPVTLTKRGLGLLRRGRQPAAAPGPQFQQNSQQPPRPPAQPQARHFDQEPEPEVYQPQYFDPQTGRLSGTPGQ